MNRVRAHGTQPVYRTGCQCDACVNARAQLGRRISAARLASGHPVGCRCVCHVTKPSAEVRFWAKVDKSGECWLWTARCNKQGYGDFMRSHGSHVRAHRYSYEVSNGPIPPNLLVCHRCDNPRCVRPDHLFLGTHADNLADMVAKGRSRRGVYQTLKTHCKNGHPFDAANTIVRVECRRKKAGRRCRACQIAAHHRRYAGAA